MSRTLSDCPVFITNMSGVLDTALEMLNDLDWRQSIDERDLSRIDRAIHLLTVGQEACELFVADVERSERQRLQNMAEGG